MRPNEWEEAAMSENTKIVQVEIVRTDDRPRPKPEEVFRQMVQQEIAKAMSNRDEWLFQPFFQQKKVSDEMQRFQSVPEQKKWSIYFKKWGCVSCGDKDQGHEGCGFCRKCYQRVSFRLRRIVKSYKPKSEDPDNGMHDDAEKIARQALEAPAATRKLPRSGGR
jgi:hypothetical protein